MRKAVTALTVAASVAVSISSGCREHPPVRMDGKSVLPEKEALKTATLGETRRYGTDYTPQIPDYEIEPDLGNVEGADALIYSGPLARAGVRSVRVTVLNPDGNVATADLPAGRWRAETAPVTRTIEGKAGKTFGYVRIPVLRPGEMAAQCKALVDKGIVGLILDLRDCRGGLVEVVAEAASVFAPAGTPLFRITQRTEDGTKTRDVAAEAGTNRLVIPIALLVNEGTASGAELLAAALTDAGIGVAVGTRSSSVRSTSSRSR